MLTKDRVDTLLIVDDDAGILSTMDRLFRREGYALSLAQSGKEGLERLSRDEIGVIVADQHMLDMDGCEFFRRARELRPDSVRIVLTGYTELSSVTDAVNRGAIFKFLTKPWEDVELRQSVREAFQLYRVTRENTRLTLELREANAALTHWNQELERRVLQKTSESLLHLQVLGVSQEILARLPLAVLGIDPEGQVVMSNHEADKLLGHAGPLLGEKAREVLPGELWPDGMTATAVRGIGALGDGERICYWRYSLGDSSAAVGTALVLRRFDPDEWRQ
jgi:FixJ family two-component response regulator